MAIHGLFIHSSFFTGVHYPACFIVNSCNAHQATCHHGDPITARAGTALQEVHLQIARLQGAGLSICLVQV